ncbi:RHS repeat-associated core domain-containing protein [Novipirellula herctigrandis]|uniref:RHS repeat-associated core domain-containing protein n=1 Tax=Novipirellula herctigrandis TaxID=2527986 RepID=UPI003AF39909
MKERYAYDAYGTPTILDAAGTALTASAENNRYTYTGREYDVALGLYHYRARMYDPVAGRFCSRDPIGYVDGLSLYGGYFVPFGVDPFGRAIVTTIDLDILGLPRGDGSPLDNDPFPDGPIGQGLDIGTSPPLMPYPGDIEPVSPSINPSTPTDPGDGVRTLVESPHHEFNFNAAITADCGGVVVTSVWTSGVTKAFVGIELHDPSVEFQSYSDCVNGRLIVSHTGYVTAVLKHTAGMDIDVALGDAGGLSIGVGGTLHAMLVKLCFHQDHLTVGAANESTAESLRSIPNK